VTNNIQFSKTATEKRKQNYLRTRYNRLSQLYGTIIQKITKNQILEALTYSIMIYEDFNRPKIVRILENIKFRLTKKTLTLGIMQVKSDKLISNEESVIIGANKIVELHKNYLQKIKHNPYEFSEWVAYDYIISNYNGGGSYSNEINRLFSIIKDTFYKDTKDTLEPKINNGL
jgi:hypothetical protein